MGGPRGICSSIGGWALECGGAGGDGLEAWSRHGGYLGNGTRCICRRRTNPVRSTWQARVTVGAELTCPPAKGPRHATSLRPSRPLALQSLGRAREKRWRG